MAKRRLNRHPPGIPILMPIPDTVAEPFTSYPRNIVFAENHTKETFARTIPKKISRRRRTGLDTILQRRKTTQKLEALREKHRGKKARDPEPDAPVVQSVSSSSISEHANASDNPFQQVPQESTMVSQADTLHEIECIGNTEHSTAFDSVMWTQTSIPLMADQLAFIGAIQEYTQYGTMSNVNEPWSADTLAMADQTSQSAYVDVFQYDQLPPANTMQVPVSVTSGYADHAAAITSESLVGCQPFAQSFMMLDEPFYSIISGQGQHVGLDQNNSASYW